MAGTVTGAFAAGQVVVGTGVPANTYITGPAGAATPGGWLLSQACSTESSETVTAFAPLPIPDFALITPTGQNVMWRDDGTAPTASIGNLLETTIPEPVGISWESHGDPIYRGHIIGET